ncbi:hypothetical protein AMS68_000668 [Peltaster fructicola]|uniref:Uncharacterized protein n=1 Tax=Peltaster fructicola TaxID=286661 RepID=A0A6H0XKJ0_9PEZI|nr:hypothetical protein AMS68_000668 [Peltaster fructicola]
MAQQICERLLEHLQKLQADPANTSVDTRLIDEADLVLPEQLQPQELLQVIQNISSTLSTIRQDPSPLTNLLQKLLVPFSFADVLSFDPPVDFVSGLNVADHMVAINRLMLYLLEKAKRPADVATIANWPKVVQAYIHLWLATSDIGVASRAGQLLVNLLRIDKPSISHPDQKIPEPGTGQGLLWKRLFQDQDVYGTIYSDCDLKGSKLSKGQVTLAQSRLLEILPQLAALDWGAVTSSYHHGIESEHGLAEGGLLSFAALKMVDYKDDVLSHCVLVDFYTQLLVSTRPTDNLEPANGLNFLLDNKIHDRVAGIYLQSANTVDPLEGMFLYGPAANYLATYASLYSLHYMASPMPVGIKARLTNAFSLSVARWAHADSPKHDLHLLASLPRSSLLPQTLPSSSQDRTGSLLSMLPSRATNPDVLNTLAVIFHGPVEESVFPTTPSAKDQENRLKEAAAARALYLHYLASNQQLWKDIAQHADTVALVDLALAAIRLLTSVITADWSTQPETDVPSSLIATPESGHLAILSPPALEYALPYLMKPPQTFSNLVGGRGDAESAAYKIAMAKYDALHVFHTRLATHIQSQPDSGLEDVLATLGKRLAEGPMSRSGEVGGRIATMEL